MVRSTDSGNTWLPPQLPGTSPIMSADVDAVIAVNENVFYVGSWRSGLHRSTDAGKSWDIVNITPDTGQISNLIAEKGKGHNMPPTLYARYKEEKVVKTTDRGDILAGCPHRDTDDRTGQRGTTEYYSHRQS